MRTLLRRSQRFSAFSSYDWPMTDDNRKLRYARKPDGFWKRHSRRIMEIADGLRKHPPTKRGSWTSLVDGHFPRRSSFHMCHVAITCAPRVIAFAIYEKQTPATVVRTSSTWMAIRRGRYYGIGQWFSATMNATSNVEENDEEKHSHASNIIEDLKSTRITNPAIKTKTYSCGRYKALHILFIYILF